MKISWFHKIIHYIVLLNGGSTVFKSNFLYFNIIQNNILKVIFLINVYRKFLRITKVKFIKKIVTWTE